MIALLILYRRKETNRGQLTCPKSHSWYGGTWVQTQISPNHKACDLKGPPTFLAPGAGFMEDSSSPDQRWEGGEQFLDDSSTLHITLVGQLLSIIIITSVPLQIIRG